MSASQQNTGGPLVTVLMSVYNGERFLRESVESILRQSFGDFEFLIMEDGSTDSTAVILAEYAAKDRRIRVVKNEENIGLTRSLNHGLALARGKYVARQDADDLSLPERLARQVEFMEAHPDTVLLGTGMEVINEGGKTLGRRIPPADQRSLAAELLIKNNAFGHTSVMFRLAAVNELGGYDESFAFAQDYDLWWRMSRKWKVAVLPEALVRWRASGSNISGTWRAEQLDCMYRISVKAVAEVIGRESLDEEAYGRFWRAFHGKVEELRPGDIERLNPLWDYLAA
ncbi:MAG TPA: glycosyltransferase, partial [Candidatus Glassbacteria bacterium]|nr:glycosyltransferase [Candidatus Glassbacteria bacterium]